MQFYPRIGIHTSDDISLPDQFGMDIQPRTSSNFAISQVLILQFIFILWTPTISTAIALKIVLKI